MALPKRKDRALAASLILLCFAGVATSCRRANTEPTADQSKNPKDPIIAVVNGREIQKSSFDTFLRLREIEQKENDVPVPEKEIFREFIVDQLLSEAADKAGVEVSDEEVSERFGSLLTKDDAGLSDHLIDFRNLLRIQKFVRQKLVGSPKIEAVEMERYYKANPGEFVVDDKVHVLEILVSSQQAALDLRKKLRPRDFNTFHRIAKEHSIGLTAEQSGDLGVFEAGELPEEFEKVIFRLKPGQVSSVFQSEHGYHIFMIEEFIPRHTRAFHEVQKEIYEKMLAQIERVELDKYVEEMLRRASIEILDPNLQFDWRKSDAKGDQPETGAQGS